MLRLLHVEAAADAHRYLPAATVSTDGFTPLTWRLQLVPCCSGRMTDRTRPRPGVGSQAGERLRCSRRDVDRSAVLADLRGSLVGGFFLAASVGALGLGEEEHVGPAAFGASVQDLSSNTSRVPCFSPGM